MLDYARSYGLPTVVFRMSCIYGPHQFGTEDQGWVAHFLIRALQDEPITIYGDGKQVRDMLYIDDLVDALLLRRRHLHDARRPGLQYRRRADNTISLLELRAIDALAATSRASQFGEWRRRRSALLRFRHRANSAAATGWQPQVGVAEGFARLHRGCSRPAPRPGCRVTEAAQ